MLVESFSMKGFPLCQMQLLPLCPSLSRNKSISYDQRLTKNVNTLDLEIVITTLTLSQCLGCDSQLYISVYCDFHLKILAIHSNPLVELSLTDCSISMNS